MKPIILACALSLSVTSAAAAEDVEWGQSSADRLTLTFSAAASSPGDQFRIITASPAVVPEPASLLLLGTGLAACVLRRSRRR